MRVAQGNSIGSRQLPSPGEGGKKDRLRGYFFQQLQQLGGPSAINVFDRRDNGPVQLGIPKRPGQPIELFNPARLG
jgi:hypothetical protein